LNFEEDTGENTDDDASADWGSEDEGSSEEDGDSENNVV
jgi:hypothetical protein